MGVGVEYMKEISCILHIRTELSMLVQIYNLISGEAEAWGLRILDPVGS